MGVEVIMANETQIVIIPFQQGFAGQYGIGCLK